MSTDSNLMDNLSSIDTYIVTVNSDINKFNVYAKINCKSLATRGERYNNMMSNLFKEYLAAGEKDFFSYIQHQKDKYDYGENIDKDRLMTLALNKYGNLCTKGKWLVKSPEQQHNMAVSAEQDKMNYTNLKLSKLFNANGTPKIKTNKQVNQKWNKTPPLGFKLVTVCAQTK